MQRFSLIIFFNRDSIPVEHKNSLPARRIVVEKGVEILRARFPDLIVGAPIHSSCAVGLQVDEAAFVELEEFLKLSKLGTYEFAGSMIVAARGS